MMLANHTSIRNIFKVLLEQYKKFRKRGAYLNQYKETKIFEESLDEFDDSEETVRKLIEEYAAAEKEDYINWGAGEDEKDGAEGMDYM
jgi:tubulin gamma